MKELKEKIELIIEQSNSDKPKCKNCKSFSNGKCMFGCLNEKSSSGYSRVVSPKMTTPDYSCSNFEGMYVFNEDVTDILNDVLKDIERVNEAKKNIELLLNGKIDESDFIDIMK